MRICVYCASSSAIAPIYFEHTAQLAESFLEHKIEVVFGGGSEGLMGILADTIIKGNGKIQGVMPQFMKDIEWAHPQVTDFIFVENMRERKKILMDNTDALVALPGGTGTFEELFEAITLKRLGKYTKPIIILNTDGFYEPLIALLNKCVDEKFLGEQHSEMWQFVDHPNQVIPAIKATPEWKEDAINYAVVK